MDLFRPIALAASLVTLFTFGCPTSDPLLVGDDDDATGLAPRVLPDLANADPVPDRACDDALVLSAEWPAVETLGLLHVSVLGGSGQAEVRLTDSPSGAIFDDAVGTYIAGATPEVTDRLLARDLNCFGEASLEIDVVRPLEVRPSEGEFLPGDAFTFEAVGGSGDVSFTAVSLRTEGSLTPDGAYVAGALDGLDEAEAMDQRTGRRMPLSLTVRAGATLEPAPARIILPIGSEGDVVVAGGSGWTDLTPDVPGLATIETIGDSVVVQGVLPGDVVLTVQDRFASMASTIVVQVVDTQTGSGARGGHGSFRALAFGPGDIDGDGYRDALLGVMEASVGGHRSGAVYVYAGGPSGLAPAPARVISWPEWFAEMGEDFAVEDIDGDGLDDLIVGVTRANRDRSSSGLPPWEDTGAVAIYSGVTGGFYSSEPTAIITGTYGSDHFGKSLAVCDINGDGALDLAVGARYADDRSGSPVVYTTGGVQIHLGDGSGQFSDTPDQLLTGVQPDGAGGWVTDAGQEMGYDLAGGDFDGDGLCDLAVGGYNWSSGVGRSRDNLVTIWRGQADGSAGAPTTGGLLPWPVLAIAPLAPENDQGYFGREVKLVDLDADGRDDLLVGQHRYTDPNISSVYHGAVRIYEGRLLGDQPAAAITPAASAIWMHAGTNGYDYVGAQLDLADVNGDGVLDLIIGESREEGNGSPNDAGALGIFLGQAGGFPETTATYELFGSDGDERLGVGVAALGDVDGDGLDDLLGFASQGDLHGVNVGVPWYFSGIDGSVEAAPLDLPGIVAGDGFGESAAVIGDVNGDGWDDVAVGASELSTETSVKPGGVHIYLGSAAGLPAAPSTTLTGFAGNTGSDRAGFSVAPAGDFDGDGLADLAVVARYDDKSTNLPAGFNDPGDCPTGYAGDVGAVYIFRGTGPGQPPPAEPAFLIYGPQTSQRVDVVDGGGDLNADGRGDVVFGGWEWDRPGANGTGGFAAVLGRPYSGAGVDVICSYDAQLLGANAAYRLGRDLAFLGDTDGDGCDDFAVGAYLADWTANNEGAVHVVRGWGGPGCPSEPTQAIFTPQDSNDQAGIGVGGGGDIDGDGVPDLVVGAPYFYASGATRGSAWVVPGAWLAAVPYEPLDPDGTTFTWPFWPIPESQKEDWRVPGVDAESRTGWDVSIVPNYANGRGVLALGTPRGAAAGVEWAGGVDLYAWSASGGSMGGIDLQPVGSFVGEMTRDGYSGSFVRGGTLDGSPTLVVGGPRSDATAVDRGAAWVVEMAP